MHTSRPNSLIGDSPLVQAPFVAFDADAYTDSLAKVCGSFHVEPGQTGLEKISGSVQHRLISRFDTAFVSLDAKRVVRDKSMIRLDPGEHLFLIYQDKGCCSIVQNDRFNQLLVGDFFIADSSVPSEFIYEGKPSTQVSLHLPRDEMVARLGRACIGGQPIDRSDPLIPTLSSIFRHMLSVDRGSPSLGEALVNILCEYFHARLYDYERMSTRVYQRAVERLHARACDNTFNIDALALDLNVSRRTLQRVFADHEDNFTTRLRSVRLEMARIRLASGNPNIAGIAYDCGFNDISNFYRLFRERFGVTPGRIKQA